MLAGTDVRLLQCQPVHRPADAVEPGPEEQPPGQAAGPGELRREEARERYAGTFSTDAW
jgi:hypothetical protein